MLARSLFYHAFPSLPLASPGGAQVPRGFAFPPGVIKASGGKSKLGGQNQRLPRLKVRMSLFCSPPMERQAGKQPRVEHPALSSLGLPSLPWAPNREIPVLWELVQPHPFHKAEREQCQLY